MLIFQGLLLGLSAGTQPGPFQAYLISRALRGGWRRTWNAALAPLISDGPIVLLCVLVLTQLPGWFTRGLRLAGGLYLLYLAWKVYQVLRFEHSAPSGSAAINGLEGQSIFQAALLNLLNPAPWIFWSTVAGPAFLQGWRVSPVTGLGFLLSFYASMLALLMATVAVFSAAGRLDARIVRTLNLISGLALVGFGLYQVWVALAGGV
jgi:threonine/homoserine/homoserine lactone efflux protein